MTDREMKPADREMKPAAEDTFYVDLVQGGVPGRFSGYLVAAPRPALIESGSARDVEIWLDALDRMGVPRSDVAYVVVTHVHLDHGGGAGVLLKELPSARLVVHRAGARHMVDPTRLVQGSRPCSASALSGCSACRNRLPRHASTPWTTATPSTWAAATGCASWRDAATPATST